MDFLLNIDQRDKFKKNKDSFNKIQIVTNLLNSKELRLNLSVTDFLTRQIFFGLKPVKIWSHSLFICFIYKKSRTKTIITRLTGVGFNCLEFDVKCEVTSQAPTKHRIFFSKNISLFGSALIICFLFKSTPLFSSR